MLYEGPLLLQGAAPPAAEIIDNKDMYFIDNIDTALFKKPATRRIDWHLT